MAVTGKVKSHPDVEDFSKNFYFIAGTLKNQILNA